MVKFHPVANLVEMMSVEGGTSKFTHPMIQPILMSEPQLSASSMSRSALYASGAAGASVRKKVGRKIQYNVNNVLAALDRFERKAS